VVGCPQWQGLVGEGRAPPNRLAMAADARGEPTLPGLTLPSRSAKRRQLDGDGKAA